ncbi:MAG: hypothetical protein H6617_03615 [Bdellovibrionaceae bacterium]|nr:hypothetical protein [Pseudobdellovibrionaceae bacterium]
MRELKFVVLLLVSFVALAENPPQVKPPEVGPFIPPGTQKKEEHAPQKGEVLPPPTVTEEREQVTDAEALRKAEIALRMEQLNERNSVLRLWSQLNDPALQAKLRNNPAAEQTLHRRMGEVLAILKNLIGFPPHVFGRPISVEFDTKDPNNILMSIIDVQSELPLGVVSLKEQNVTDFVPNQENLAAVIKVTPNRLRLLTEADPNVLKMAASAAEVYNENYRDEVAEGYFEQLAKDVLQIPPKANGRELFSEFVSGRNYAPGYDHNSTMIVFKDKQSGERLGIVGFHYDTNRPNDVRLVNFGLGPNVRGNHLLDNVKLTLHNLEAEKRKQPQP